MTAACPCCQRPLYEAKGIHTECWIEYHSDPTDPTGRDLNHTCSWGEDE